MKNIVSAGLFCLATAAFGGSLSDGKLTYSQGNWKVLRTVDPMTDKVQCTGVFKDNYAVQLTSVALFVRPRGGVRSVTTRFGDEPAQPFRLASDIESSVGSVRLNGDGLEAFLRTGRVRLQIGTTLGGVADVDVTGEGLAGAYEHIKAGCPG